VGRCYVERLGDVGLNPATWEAIASYRVAKVRMWVAGTSMDGLRGGNDAGWWGLCYGCRGFGGLMNWS